MALGPNSLSGEQAALVEKFSLHEQELTSPSHTTKKRKNYLDIGLVSSLLRQATGSIRFLYQY
jgi:hypothetical protein